MRDDIDMTFKDAIPNRKDPDLKPESEKGNLAGQHKDNFLSDLASSLDKNEVNRKPTRRFVQRILE